MPFLLALLPRLIGPGKALDLLWSSRKVEAEEAYRLGLIDRIVPHDELVDTAKAYIENLAAVASPTSTTGRKVRWVMRLRQPPSRCCL